MHRIEPDFDELDPDVEKGGSRPVGQVAKVLGADGRLQQQQQQQQGGQACYEDVCNHSHVSPAIMKPTRPTLASCLPSDEGNSRLFKPLYYLSLICCRECSQGFKEVFICVGREREKKGGKSTPAKRPRASRKAEEWVTVLAYVDSLAEMKTVPVTKPVQAGEQEQNIQHSRHADTDLANPRTSAWFMKSLRRVALLGSAELNKC
eukprot:1139081-Pelagomonas_calceolata.AAC.4